MNERYKELAREAGLLVYNPEGVPTKLEKFAELIVQECINVVYRQERIPKEFFYPKPAHQHELAIKSHFGIE